jgi:hypothetical protein
MFPFQRTGPPHKKGRLGPLFGKGFMRNLPCLSSANPSSSVRRCPCGSKHFSHTGALFREHRRTFLGKRHAPLLRRDSSLGKAERCPRLSAADQIDTRNAMASWSGFEPAPGIMRSNPPLKFKFLRRYTCCRLELKKDLKSKLGALLCVLGCLRERAGGANAQSITMVSSCLSIHTLVVQLRAIGSI